jgi:hypothetical protein
MEYKIYRIVCNETNEVYFGKTTQTLSKRLSQHRENGHSYTSNQIILRGDYYIEQIDSTFDEIESIILERYYIETFECVNQVIPGRTRKEWLEENSEYMKEYSKKYREENSEYFKEYSKKYREENSEYFKEYEKQRSNNEERKEYKKEYRKEYYEKHKDEIKEKQKEKYTCECGTTLTLHHKSRHERESKKHINFINSK